MRVDSGGNEYMDGDDGPILREVREDGALVMTQGDTVWVTEGYDLDRYVDYMASAS